MQRQIVSDLEKLIDASEDNRDLAARVPTAASRPGMAQKKPGQPSGDSSASAQTSDPKPRRAPEAIRAEEAKKAVEQMKGLFAELQGHEREHVLEPPSEHFLPEYELEIEDYFRRLSEDPSQQGKP